MLLAAQAVEDISVKETVWYLQEAQHLCQHSTAAKGNHVHSARADLNALKCFGSETSTAVR